MHSVILTPIFLFTNWYSYRAHAEKIEQTFWKGISTLKSLFLFWDVLITKSIEDLLCFYMSKSSFRYIHSFFGFDCLTKATGHFGAVKIFEKYFRSNRFLILGYNRVCNSTHRELTRTMLTAKFNLYKILTRLKLRVCNCKPPTIPKFHDINILITERPSCKFVKSARFSAKLCLCTAVYHTSSACVCVLLNMFI